eukprot:661763-Pelagomonas_calceolata.AAC.1
MALTGLDHIFVCSKNLKFCEGSIKAKNFRIGQPKKESREADGGVAILNENWAMYLRESFLEASVVIFVINEDWLDSIPCNQEFEALITRKRQLQGAQKKNAIIFVDITNEKFNQRWGGKLPQVLATASRSCPFPYSASPCTLQESTAQSFFIVHRPQSIDFPCESLATCQLTLASFAPSFAVQGGLDI